MGQVYRAEISAVNAFDIRELSQLRPWKSMLAILLDWLIIAAAIFFHKLFGGFWLYLLVWLIISTRLYALYSLLHDAVHYSIIRHKRWNDWIARIMLAFPLMINLQTMRKNHLDHHKFLQTEKDPERVHLSYDEFQFPKEKLALIRIALGDITGINFVYYKWRKLFSLLKQQSLLSLMPAKNILNWLMYLIVFSLFIFSGHAADLFLYWLLPLFTGYQLLNRLRLSTEHFYLDADNPFKTRSVISSWAERQVFAPHNLGFHLDHHLYPGVPFYNLPALHRQLQKDPEYAEHEVTLNSFRETLSIFIKNENSEN